VCCFRCHRNAVLRNWVKCYIIGPRASRSKYDKFSEMSSRVSQTQTAGPVAVTTDLGVRFLLFFADISGPGDGICLCIFCQVISSVRTHNVSLALELSDSDMQILAVEQADETPTHRDPNAGALDHLEKQVDFL
jgi:hypothetical protein